jgi:nucleolar protein 56
MWVTPKGGIMTGDAPTSAGWFDDVDPDDLSGARDAIERGTSESPADWPTRAVEAGFAVDEDEYYDKLHKATTAAARERVRRRRTTPRSSVRRRS